KNRTKAKLSLYNSLAYNNAVYVSGDYTGNRVEYAPRIIERCGFNYWLNGFTLNAQYSYQGFAYGDATNTASDPSAETGIIPAYHVMDISTSYKFKNCIIHFGVNNFTNQKYFTLRTSEYPGPGIIPVNGIMLYGGLTITL
ncbi:MAG TPA: TonB-dependent receptor, partial [Chitinophagaceae bacterium]|nr:TonB-dependent receptor [Chitinophagaceae bacterium]